MFSWFLNLSIRLKITLLVSGMTLVFISILVWEQFILDRSKIGSPAYLEIKNYHRSQENVLTLKANLIEVRLALLSFVNESVQEKLPIHLAKISNLSIKIDGTFSELAEHFSDPEINISLTAAQFTWAEFRDTRNNEIIPAVLDGDKGKASAIAGGIQLSRYNRFIELLNCTLNTMVLKIQDYESETKIMVERGYIFVNIGYLISILLIVVFYRTVQRTIINPVKQITEISGEINNRNFAKQFKTSGAKDEIGTMGKMFQQFVQSMNKDLRQVEKISNLLDSSSIKARNYLQKEMQISIESMKKDITEIDHQTENSTAGIEELAATVEEMSRNISSITNNMVRQSSAVEEGASSIEEMVRNIENTATMSMKSSEISKNLNNVSMEGTSAVRDSIQSIREVSDYSQQIIKLINLITNIAKQTNLLAMNAAIEAAHAGDAGKGFAIVADEIRRLSEDTNKNARDIGEVVSSIVNRIDDSVRLAEKAGLGLETIGAYTGQNMQIITQLSVALQEQSNGAKEILKATEEIVKITEEVKISMIEQKNANDEFAVALRELRDTAADNLSHIKSHLDSTNHVLNSIENIREIIEENQKMSGELRGFVTQFKLQDNQTENPEEKTALKLVE